MDSRRIVVPLGWLAASCLLMACASERLAVTQGFDFSKVRQISVAEFGGTGGRTVADEFVRQLVGAGQEVTDMAHPGHLIVKGQVVAYKPNNSSMVFLGNVSLVTPSGQTITVEDPVFATGSSPIATGAPSAQLASVTSVVGVTAQMIDPSSGRVVWTGSKTYESLDLEGATQAVVRSLTRAITRLLPAARPRPS